MRPMLATRGDRVPTGEAWVHEVKWDGMRLLTDTSTGTVRLFSRNENDVTDSFPELAGLDLPAGLLLDGEAIAFADTVPSFAALAERMHVRDPGRARALSETVPVTLILFDALRVAGTDLTARPLATRREALERLWDSGDLAGTSLQVPPTYPDGPSLLSAAREQGLEGIVSKRIGSVYRPGRRSRDWLKFPLRSSGSFVVGGWRHETGSQSRLGAVLVGEPGPGGLRYRGRVGSGVAGRAADLLAGALAGLASARDPFADEVPAQDRRGTVWVRPEVVVEVDYLRRTSDGRLRQPAYRGLRTDLSSIDLEN